MESPERTAHELLNEGHSDDYVIDAISAEWGISKHEARLIVRECKKQKYKNKKDTFGGVF